MATQASGLLAARMTLGHYIMLFRTEAVRSIRWGGKPEKVVSVDKDGSKYFGPRRSFALYLDKVHFSFCPVLVKTWPRCSVIYLSGGPDSRTF